MLLDMKTIIFSYVITDIVCLVVIVLLWQQNRKRFAGTGFFVFDFALQTAALFLVVLRGQIPDWISMVLSNTLAMTGALLGYMGLLRFVGKKSSQIHNYALLAAFVFVHAYFALVQPHLAARNLNLSVVLLIICFQCSWLMLYSVRPGMRQLTQGVGIVFAAFCVISAIRIVAFFTGAQSSADYLRSGIFEQFVLISYQMLFILLTYSLALMFNKRLLLDITTQENKFSKAFHSSPYAITITRLTDGQIIEVNEGFVNITGYQLAEVKESTTIGMHLWDKDEDRALVVKELGSKGIVREREFQFRKKSGEIITGLFSAEIITVNNEKCVLSSINDITGRKRVEKEIKTINRIYTILSNINQAIVRIHDEQLLFNEACRIAVDDGGFLMAWIGLVNTATNKVDVVASSGKTGEYLNDINNDLNNELLSLGPTGLAVKRGKRFFSNNIETDDRMIPWREKALKLGYRSSITLPLIVSEKTIGTYTMYADETDFFNEDEIKLLDELASDISFALEFIGSEYERKRAESQREADLEEIRRLNQELEQRVTERTRELHKSQMALLNLVDDLNQSARSTDLINRKLEETNKELAAFSYSVSHDLRAPLRSIDGFSLALLEDCRDKLDDAGKNYLGRIRQAAQHMGLLIDDMLKLSKISHAEFRHESIDLSKIVQSIAETFQQNNPDYNIKMTIQEDMLIKGDLSAMRIAMTNLLENAWKFTGKQKYPLIEFGMTLKEGKKIFFIRDNGVGFEMAYVNKLFGAFQRLHKTGDFPGTGIGLATVKRIITRHGGQIWAESEVGKGATFFFTLPE